MAHGDLDRACRHRHFHWPTYRDALYKFEVQARQEKAHVIVDIGAGTQCSPELRQYLENKRAQVVLIYGPPEEVIERNPLGPERPMGSYRSLERDSRAELYSVAGHRIDVTGKSEEQVQKEFVDYLITAFRDLKFKADPKGK